MAALRRVRRDLAAWELPQGVETRPRRARHTAAWLAAAAALVAALGAGVLLSGAGLHRDPGPVIVRWGASAGDLQGLRSALQSLSIEECCDWALDPGAGLPPAA